MTELHEANLMWRMENMDGRTRRRVDERAGLLAHMLRRAAGSGRAARREAARRASTAPVTG